MPIKNKTTRLIATILVISVIVPSVLFLKPQKTEAFAGWIADLFAPHTAASTSLTAAGTTGQLALKLKEVSKEILRGILQNLAKKFLQKMTTSTINWINSGFHGAPLFLENPGSFFKDIAKSEVKTFVDSIGYDRLRHPFGRDVALNIINLYKQKAQSNAEYSLGRVINDPSFLTSFRGNFSVGGWNGFLLTTQYPQNNPYGYRMIENDNLARQLEGTADLTAPARKINTALQQGMGFLSPQVCPVSVNASYNNLKNEFQQPSYKPLVYDAAGEPACVATALDEEGNGVAFDCSKRDAYVEEYNTASAKAKADWDKTNACKNPDGTSALVNTTPGSVVANQIMGALNSGREQGQLAVAMGNSISAILDALVNKFMTDGLNKLATKVNPVPAADDWNYEGQTLDGPPDGTAPWNAGPDELVILSDFKNHLNGYYIGICAGVQGSDGTLLPDQKNISESQCRDAGGIWTQNPPGDDFIAGDISNTETELKLMDNYQEQDSAGIIGLSKAGIAQLLSATWPRAQELDRCIPGPDLKWEERMDKEKDTQAAKLVEKSSDDDPEEAARARAAYNELNFALDGYRDWAHNAMMRSGLPGSPAFMDAVDAMEDLHAQSDQLVTAKRLKFSALTRLQSINAVLNTMSDQPAPGSANAKTLVEMMKQYKAIQDSIATPTSIDSRRNEVSILKEKWKGFGTMIADCNQQRTGGWSSPGGANAWFGSDNVNHTEIKLFCEEPMYNGYSHGDPQSWGSPSFLGATVNPMPLPVVNAHREVFKYDKAFGSGKVFIRMNCGHFFNSSILDYKGSIPGVASIVDDEQCTIGTVDGPPETCSDNIMNQDETGIDVGGVCDTCTDGRCNQNETCMFDGGATPPDQGGVCDIVYFTCSDGTQVTNPSDCPVGGTCFDGICNQDESCVQDGGISQPDIGGVCGGEVLGAHFSQCIECENGIQDGNETGVDSGGRCGTCDDGQQNGTETGIDSGGNCDGSADVCPNINGIQYTLPGGYQFSNGQCIIIDVCPNVSGNQIAVPTGYELVNGQCTAVVDVCPNINGNQVTPPLGFQIVNGQCVEIADLCPNLAGVQETLPDGYQIVNGMCTLIPADACPNLTGQQDDVPTGYQLVNGQCVLIPDDVCPNLAGQQDTVPSGYQLVNGQCIIIPVTVDVCPNLAGDQDTVPTGYQLVNGQCVVEIADVCPNIAGNQDAVPFGYEIQNGQCVQSVCVLPASEGNPNFRWGGSSGLATIVLNAKNSVEYAVGGYTPPASDCLVGNIKDRLEIIRRTAQTLTDLGIISVGYWDDASVNVCESHNVTVVAFSDGYKYIALSGSDGLTPSWIPATCMLPDGTIDKTRYTPYDLCPNIAGTQAAIPDGDGSTPAGYTVVNGQCVAN